MSWKNKTIDPAAILNSVLPEYKKISEAKPDERDHALYKSIDANGNIYLITNPASWEWGTDVSGEPCKFRPAPRLALSASEVAAEVSKVKDKPTALPTSNGETKLLVSI